MVPVDHLVPGWYLVYWRVISEDGHPVRGAFTFAVGPNPGPAPQFVIPSLSETAATPGLVAARWAVFLSVMLAVGLFSIRPFIARPVAAAAPRAMRALSIALGLCLAVALVAIPVYMLVTPPASRCGQSTDMGGRRAADSRLGAGPRAQRHGDRRPRCSPDGRGGDPDRPGHRAALGGGATRDDRSAARRGAALLAVPGLAGHAAQTSPAALSLAFDWVHVLAASLWLGGLAGLLLLMARSGDQRTEVLGVAVPRFSRLAVASVLA